MRVVVQYGIPRRIGKGYEKLEQAGFSPEFDSKNRREHLLVLAALAVVYREPTRARPYFAAGEAGNN
jgi:hypothetical protein